MRVINSIYQDFSAWVAVVKLLKNIIILINEVCSFNSNILFQSINLVSYSDSQMFPGRNPRKGITAQVHWRKWLVSLKKSNAFSFAFWRVWVRAEPEIMVFCISFTSFNHFLKSILWRSKKQRVIRISLDTKVGFEKLYLRIAIPCIHAGGVGKLHQQN